MGSNDAGSYSVSSRRPKVDNNKECSAFMDGKKRVAIISEAASTGISLHASISSKNPQRRMHLILQLPWSAEKAIQQLGRTHRSHQTCPPHYKLLITELGGERRLASVVAMRLAALGALTSGDRRATSACEALSEFVISTKYGCDAIQKLSKTLEETSTCDFGGGNIDFNFLAALAKAKALGGISGGNRSSERVKRFLNRLLGLEVEDQRLVFSHFIESYDQTVLQAQMKGTFDDGIYDVMAEIVS